MAFKVNQFLTHLFQTTEISSETNAKPPVADPQLPVFKTESPGAFHTWSDLPNAYPLNLGSRPQLSPKVPDWAPSLAEICANQRPNALVQALHEQAAWFYDFESQGESEIPEAFIDFPVLSFPQVQILAQALPPVNDYQRLRLQVCGKPQRLREHGLIHLQLQPSPQHMVMVVDLSAGQWHGDTLMIPPFQEIIMSFQIFGSSDVEEALTVALLRPALELSPVVIKASFPVSSGSRMSN